MSSSLYNINIDRVSIVTDSSVSSSGNTSNPNFGYIGDIDETSTVSKADEDVAAPEVNENAPVVVAVTPDMVRTKSSTLLEDPIEEQQPQQQFITTAESITHLPSVDDDDTTIPSIEASTTKTPAAAVTTAPKETTEPYEIDLRTSLTAAVTVSAPPSIAVSSITADTAEVTVPTITTTTSEYDANGHYDSGSTTDNTTNTTHSKRNTTTTSLSPASLSGTSSCHSPIVNMYHSPNGAVRNIIPPPPALDGSSSSHHDIEIQQQHSAQQMVPEQHAKDTKTYAATAETPSYTQLDISQKAAVEANSTPTTYASNEDNEKEEQQQGKAKQRRCLCLLLLVLVCIAAITVVSIILCNISSSCHTGLESTPPLPPDTDRSEIPPPFLPALTPPPTPSPFPKAFETTEELQDAVVQYMSEQNTTTNVTTTTERYGTPINAWNVSQITDFRTVFANQHTFNETIGDWEMSAATSLYRMFANATSFARDLSVWDISNVRNFTECFADAHAYHHSLCEWGYSVRSDASTERMFADTSCPNRTEDPAFLILSIFGVSGPWCTECYSNATAELFG